MLKNVDTNSNPSVKHWAAGSRASSVVSIKGWSAGWELHCDIVCFVIVWSGCLCERMAWHLCLGFFGDLLFHETRLIPNVYEM